MTVIKAPRMTPLIVSSLTLSPARKVTRSSARLAILCSCELQARARRCRGRMPADRLPAAVVLYPDVGEHHAILDDSAEILEAPARLDRADHHVVERGCILDLDVDCVDFTALD